MTRPFVQLSNIGKTFGQVKALDEINLSIDHGRFVVLLGPSGSGKTTLLSILGGFLRPSSGQVFVEAEDVTFLPPARRPTVTVFQDYALFPHMTVQDNVAFGLAMRKVALSKRRKLANEILATVGLDGLGGRKIQQLSGGQKQRVALARAIVVEPKVLLLDEPLGALDLKIRRQMQEELVQLQRRIRTTFVHVTHDQEEAMNIADTVVVMSNGRIEDAGSPERVYLKPASLFAATFMGDTNIIPGHANKVTDELVQVTTAVGNISGVGKVGKGESACVSIRPEQLYLQKPAHPDSVNLGNFRAKSMAFQGAHRLCSAVSEEHPELECAIRLSPQVDIVEGATIQLWAIQSEIVVLKNQ